MVRCWFTMWFVLGSPCLRAVGDSHAGVVSLRDRIGTDRVVGVEGGDPCFWNDIALDRFSHLIRFWGVTHVRPILLFSLTFTACCASFIGEPGIGEQGDCRDGKARPGSSNTGFALGHAQQAPGSRPSRSCGLLQVLMACFDVPWLRCAAFEARGFQPRGRSPRNLPPGNYSCLGRDCGSSKQGGNNCSSPGFG